MKVIKKKCVKVREPILVGSKGKEKPRKFGVLGYEEVFQNTALKTIRK